MNLYRFYKYNLGGGAVQFSYQYTIPPSKRSLLKNTGVGAAVYGGIGSVLGGGIKSYRANKSYDNYVKQEQLAGRIPLSKKQYILKHAKKGALKGGLIGGGIGAGIGLIDSHIYNKQTQKERDKYNELIAKQEAKKKEQEENLKKAREQHEIKLKAMLKEQDKRYEEYLKKLRKHWDEVAERNRQKVELALLKTVAKDILDDEKLSLFSNYYHCSGYTKANEISFYHFCMSKNKKEKEYWRNKLIVNFTNQIKENIKYKNYIPII